MTDLTTTRKQLLGLLHEGIGLVREQVRVFTQGEPELIAQRIISASGMVGAAVMAARRRDAVALALVAASMRSLLRAGEEPSCRTS